MAGSGLNAEWGTQEGTCPVPGTVRTGGVLLEQRDGGGGLWLPGLSSPTSYTLSDVPRVRVCKMRIWESCED